MHILNRFKLPAGLIFLLLWLLLPCLAYAQGSPFVNGGITVFGPTGRPLAGATVTICAAGAAGIPCSPTITVYSDAALTVTATNPQTSDGLGNVFVYLAPGNYTYTVTGLGIAGKSFTATSACIPTAAACLASGIGNPATPGNSVQKANANATNFAASSITDNGTTVTVDESVAFKGPNPYVDVTRYGGVRSVSPNIAPAAGGITGNCTAGSAVISNLSSASTFQNGDGFVAYGCGPAGTLTAPTGLTVTPSVAADLLGTGHVVNAPAGGTTTYSYQVIARGKLGDFTVASAVATTTTGSVTLGINSVALTSCSRTNNVATCVTSAAHGISVGSKVNIVGTTDNTDFGGWFIVDTVADTTHFTFTNGIDNRNGGTLNTSCTGGTVYWENANHLAWTPVTGAWLYYIYRGTTLVGVSRPQTTLVTDATWDDFGATNTAGTLFPPFIPTTPPTVAGNQNLVSTIVSGAGTTALTLANTASTTVTAANVRFDDAPTILAAVNGAAGASVRFPAGTYVINSYLTLPGSISITGAGWYLNDTVEMGNFTYWDGYQLPPAYGFNSFALRGGALVQVNTANPGLHFPNSTGSYVIQGLNISNLGANGGVSLFTEASVEATYVNFITAAADQTSLNFLARGLNNVSTPFPFRFRQCSSTGGPASQAQGITSAPLMYFNTTGAPEFFDFFASRRGISFFPAAGAFETEIIGGRFQGGNTPLLSLYYTGGAFTGPVSIIQYELDTMPNAIFANLGAASNSLNSPVYLRDVNTTSADAGSFPGLVTGRALSALTLLSLGTVAIGQNVNIAQNGNFTDRLVRITGAGKYVYDLPVPAAPTLAAVAGTSPAAATYTEQITWADSFGNESALGPSASITTVAGTQGIQVTPPAAPANSGIVGYFVYRNGIKTGLGSSNCPQNALGATFTDTLGFVNPCGIGAPLLPGGGISSLTSIGFATPLVKLAGPAGSAVGASSTQSAAILTASRTVTVPDVSGVIPVSGYQNSVYDNFNRANGALGSNWTTAIGTVQVFGNTAIATVLSGGNASAIWAVGTTFSGNQFAQATVSTLNGTTDFIGPALRYSVAGSGYTCIENTTTLQIQRDDANIRTPLATSSTTGAVGDILRIEANGSTITCTRTSSGGTVTSISSTDTTYTSGSPGLFFFGTVATLDNWSGGNLHPIAQLDAEQDWTQPQHFTQAIIGGGTTFTKYSRFSVSLTPAAVAANTCAAQSFTITGVVAADILIAVSKPTEQAGLSAGLGHVTGANTATINYCNNTAASITPTAAETYQFIVVQ